MRISPVRKSDMSPGHRSAVVPTAGFLILFLLAAGTAGAFDDHVFVLTGRTGTGEGSCASLEIEAPWTAEVDLEAVDPKAVVRHFSGKTYVVNRRSGEIQVIDPRTFDTEFRFSVGSDSAPHDIMVLDERTAYVSRFESSLLYKVNPSTGELLATVDLGPLADADGVPEMSMMALDGSHLLVQVQRLDRNNSLQPVAPSYLAVVDLADDTLIDVDPVEPGVQGIVLTGLIPDLKMHVEPSRRRLYVSTPGRWHDSAGGIDEVDLDGLRALGFVVTEADFALQMGPFAMVSDQKGYVITHTDITISSHLAVFSRADGSRLSTPWERVGVKVENLAFDPVTDQLFVPFPDPVTGGGVVVLDTISDTVLTGSPVDTGLPPHDLVVVRSDFTPGEAKNLRLEDHDPVTGDFAITYEPACSAPDHVVVFGPLDDVSAHAYSGQICGIGSDGSHGPFSPGPGSYFFLIVANDGESVEGSYGTDSHGNERPEDALDPLCSFTRDLRRSCD
jgi:DNA-binding beta-propeller fold protein YncE